MALWSVLIGSYVSSKAGVWGCVVWNVRHSPDPEKLFAKGLESTSQSWAKFIDLHLISANNLLDNTMARPMPTDIQN